MSVYTSVEQSVLLDYLTAFDLGTLESYEGITEGVENTNYFVNTSKGRYVLTLFEVLGIEQLPFYIHLMAYLNEHGVACPHPIADRSGMYLHTLCDKPAVLMQRMPGTMVQQVNTRQLQQLGRALAKMHNASVAYTERVDNPRGLSWMKSSAGRLAVGLSSQDRILLEQELVFQQRFPLKDLPHAVIHADLFRDNALMDGDAVGGIIDFYFCGYDALLYDVAVTVNDWCLAGGRSLDTEKTVSFLKSYHQERSLTELERGAWPVLLRRAALRFWLSRMERKQYPVSGEKVLVKDPDEFRQLLLWHTENCLIHDEIWGLATE